VLQEQFTNILKHAQATRVTVSLRRVQQSLVLEVRDDGKGFDKRKKAKGIGITNMATRVEAFQGTLQLKSAPGKGCKLTASFPLKL
jgi:signal transduction histidine kinase